MKKTVITGILVLLCLAMTLSFASCKNNEDPDAPDGYVTASAECADYFLYVPAEWIVDTPEKSIMASARANSFSSTPNITMMPCTDDEEQYATVEAYWEYYKSSLVKLFDETKNENGESTGESSFAMVSEGISCKVGGRDAMKYVYTATLSGVSLKYLQLIVKDASQMYILTYTATEDTYDEEQINGIIENIKFKA